MVTLRIEIASILAVVAVGGFAACSSGGTSGASRATQTVTITAGLNEQALLALLVFRDGVDGAWQKPRALGDGRYEIEVQGPYAVEYVCVGRGPVRTVETARTPDDPPTISVTCSSGGYVDPVTATVHGTMTPAGVVQLGTSIRGIGAAGSDGEYWVMPPPGTYDLVAQTLTPPRWLAIRRDVTVDGAVTLAPIDVVREGVAMIDLPITVTGVPDGSQFTSGVGVYTPSTVAGLYNIDRGATTLPIVPDGALQPTDHQIIFVAIDTAGGSRRILRTVVPGGSTVLAVPPEYPVTYDVSTAQTTGRLTAHWETLAPYEQVELLAYQLRATGTIGHQLDVSASYLAAIGETSAAFDTDLPGYDPAWRIDFQSAWQIDGTVSSTGADGADFLRADDRTIFAAPGTTR
jgi:hypothetical protein